MSFMEAGRRHESSGSKMKDSLLIITIAVTTVFSQGNTVRTRCYLHGQWVAEKCTKINSRWITDRNVKGKTINLPEGNPETGKQH